jgi:hypothetical protein
MATEFKISSKRSKVMSFKGKKLIRARILLDDQILEQIIDFNYLG